MSKIKVESFKTKEKENEFIFDFSVDEYSKEDFTLSERELFDIVHAHFMIGKGKITNWIKLKKGGLLSEIKMREFIDMDLTSYAELRSKYLKTENKLAEIKNIMNK